MSLPAHLLNTTVNIQRTATQIGTSGSPYDHWNDHLSNVPARVQQLSSTEAARAGRENNRRQWKVFMDMHDVVEADRVQWTDGTIPGTSRTRTLDVQAVLNPFHLGRHLELDCQETEPSG